MDIVWFLMQLTMHQFRCHCSIFYILEALLHFDQKIKGLKTGIPDPIEKKNWHNLSFHAIKLVCKFHVDISICVHVMSVFSFWLNFEQLEKSGIPNPIFSKIWHNFIFDAIHHVYQFRCHCSIFLDSRGSFSFWPKVKRLKKREFPIQIF